MGATMDSNFRMTYNSFENKEQMLDFITQHNQDLDRYRKRILAQDAVIDVLRENIRDLIKVINSQEQAIDLTDKLMERDFGVFKNLLNDDDLGGSF